MAQLVAAAANATPPARVPFDINDTFRSRFLSNVCGFPVMVHMQATGTVKLFRDNDGVLMREIDMSATGFVNTYFSPIQLGGTGKSFTETLRSPTIILYPEGAEPGDPAIVILHGVQRTSGPGNPLNAGREVDEAVVVELSSDGAPVDDIVGTISQDGQFEVLPVAQARCAALGGP
ncbi:MAG TPA: hypothetical protein VGI14_03025 [Casimicrobiaceae bacterium]